MEQWIKHINLSGEALEGLPLFFRKIVYNKLTDPDEEAKLMKYNPRWQTVLMRDAFSQRLMSKTIDYNYVFKQENSEQ
jgi:hypothetical protein